MPRRLPILLAGLSLGAACQKDEEIRYKRFNGSDDVLTVQVGVDELLEPLTIELNSTLGDTPVGTATVDPSGGPVGTLHRLRVQVDDEFEDQVIKVTVVTASGKRGTDSYKLKGDSADEGLWGIELESRGVEGEIREDSFTIQLWEQRGRAIEAVGDTGR